jgi:predicted membrane chloride channel (bestrophin family)
MKRRNVRVHQKNQDQPLNSLNIAELNVLLRNLRLNQIYGDGDSKLYQPAIDLIKSRLSHLRTKETIDIMNEYVDCCAELERYREIENQNVEKERFYTRFEEWVPTQKHDEYVSNDKLTEVQVRLYEISERCRDFEYRELKFKEKMFGKRLASRIEF